MRKVVLLVLVALCVLGVAGVAAAEPGGSVTLRAQDRGGSVVIFR